jgi:hypothetical protein
MTVAVVPVQIKDRFREDSTVGIKLLELPDPLINDKGVAFSVAGRVDRLIPPLRPASGVGNAAFLFYR